MKHACALLFALAGILNADAITNNSFFDCNGQVEESPCEVIGPNTEEGAFLYAYMAEGLYTYAMSDDALEFSATAGAGTSFFVNSPGPDMDLYARAFISATFWLITPGQQRPGFIEYSGIGGGEGGSPHAFLFGIGENGFECFSNECSAHSVRRQFTLGMPFSASINAESQAGAERGWLHDNGGSGSGTFSFSLFEADGVTPVRLLWDDGLEGVPTGPVAAPEPANIGAAVIGCVVLYCIRKKNPLKFTL
jgi:hypothetical protein